MNICDNLKQKWYSSSVKRHKLEGLIPEAILRAVCVIRTAFEKLTSLLEVDAYSCEKCKRINYEIHELRRGLN